MATQGPLSPATTVDDATVGNIAWTNPNNSQASDNVYATSQLDPLGPDLSHYLKATNFGFTIPTGSTILGITVEIEISKAVGPGTTMADNSCKIVKGGTISGNENKSVTAYTTTDTYLTHGSASDLWGLTWVVSDINASNFGVAISSNSTGANVATAQIDHIRITVTYTPPPTVAAPGGFATRLGPLGKFKLSPTPMEGTQRPHRRSKRRKSYLYG